ncbi:leucine-rich repeat domain-containing protein [uncultured Catenibacterium sp.]|jgi:hypothetical protein|uniref:leucine-rich repeat domain-containing protein n=1 Tax=uncultured Catenibacterium sp. TaxID=286142 RepID=UPI00259AD0F3|nr:leucine-rich repeat domain-containing protein [uncultured Catenibacterium sp.]
MADLVYMTKEAWVAITDAFRNKLGSTEMIKAGDIPSALNSFQKYVEMISDNVSSVSDENVTLVRSYGFRYCKKLQEVYLPNVTFIGSSAFEQCEILPKINIQNVETLDDSALAGCCRITELYLPKAITIGRSACNSMTALKKVTLGNVKTIGMYAFQSNEYCKEIDISLNENVDSIGAHAFYNNLRLSKLTIRGTALIPLNDSDALGYTLIASGEGKIYVDPSMVETYKTATNWSKYANVIEAIS